MNLSFWNIRGLNKSSKQRLVKHHLLQYHLSFLALLETKVKDTNLSITAKKIEKNWQWLSNVGNSGKARILVMWDPCILDVQVVKISEQHITCSVKSVDEKICGLISAIFTKIWGILLGYYVEVFNTMINNEEKLGGVALTTVDTSDFNSFIEDCQLSHLKTLGCFYTWSNKQESGSRIWCRLERALVNGSWINLYYSSHVEFLQPGLSDHSPAFVSIYDDYVQGKKPFKFFKMLTKHPSFIPIVSKTWQTTVEGYKMYSVSTKLKLLKGNLKELNKKHFYNITEQVQRARVALEEVQRNLYADPFNSSLINQEKDFLSSYKRLLDCELSFYQQKARIAWSLQGDRGTSFFHAITKSNKHNNRVMVLHNANGDRITDGEGIVNEFVSFYRKLMGSAVVTIPPDMDIINFGPILNAAQARELSRPVTRDEIKSAIFSMAENKAPGPDGYNVAFFKSAWAIIGEEITVAIEEFFSSGKLLGMVNSTSITLIPKVHCRKTPSDYRPISCCNCLYKFISKIITNRIKTVMGYIVNDAQSAFVRGRQISSNIKLAHELVNSYNRKHLSPRVMLNVDIRKAFDTISWCFLSDLLHGLGFPQGKHGLRQGDPLSPYLFILGMEYLSRKLGMLKNDRLFKFHPKCSQLNITHLIFADDLLLFVKGDVHSVHKLFQCVKEFSAVSGLEANPEKCSVFFGGIDESVKSSINSYLGFPEGVLPFKYLGVPLTTKKLSHMDCKSLLSKISGQFQKWLNHGQCSQGNGWVMQELLVGEIRSNSQNSSGCMGESLHGEKETSALKCIWDIHIKKESLWIKWIHGVYLKHEDIWQVKARSGDSWLWKQLLKVRDKALVLFGGVDNLKGLISSCWKGFSHRTDFIGEVSSMKTHVFSALEQPIVNWYAYRLKGRGLKQHLKKMALITTIYFSCRERNLRLFQQRSRSADVLVRDIKFDVLTSILNTPSIAILNTEYLMYINLSYLVEWSTFVDLFILQNELGFIFKETGHFWAYEKFVITDGENHKPFLNRAPVHLLQRFNGGKDPFPNTSSVFVFLATVAMGLKKKMASKSKIAEAQGACSARTPGDDQVPAPSSPTSSTNGKVEPLEVGSTNLSSPTLD
ncbi:uncharacterized protein LOC109837129 [Asparagus officinalis]|uniref:uncharacterized protein LOC109837129 n=1 Tax=Asparagus officinalis TaxID=4686 RepID=UPI00098E0EEA|nr:uncharacterized protein LOC109837129 [Asparagus officinalis]